MKHAHSTLLLLALLSLTGLAAPEAGAKDPPAAKQEPGVPDAALQAAIDAAIDKGAAWIRSQQKSNGSFGGLLARGQTQYEIGTTALCGLALLAAGDERGDESVDKVFHYIQTRDTALGQAGTRSTYDAGTLLMFVTAYFRGKSEEDSGSTRPGRSRGNPCDMPDDVKQWLQEVVDWLVRVRKPATSTWGYPAHRDDHSNTQYAYLGLRAARDCGARIPNQVFQKGIETMLARQEADGPKVPRVLPSPDPDASPYVIHAGDRARGWSYLPDPPVATGSMTTAGIAVLAICNDALMRPKRVSAYTGKMERDVARAVQDGFAWLDVNFDVTKNPGRGAPAWHYYYLYGLERAAVLGGRALIGQHDWYLDGARYLVAKQQGDGHWSTGALGDDLYEASDLLDTAWAVLFLARATRPAPPLRAPVVTESD